MKLAAEVREPQKKGAARRLRRAGRIPAVMYGHGEPSTPVSLEQSEFDALLRTREGTVIIEVDVAERGQQQTIIREIQRDPVTGRILHVDLQHISLTETINVEVPMHVTGTPYGVKTEGGILEHHLRAVEIECLPGSIPPYIEVDVTELKIGDSIHVEELAIDREAITVLADPRTTVVAVIPPRLVKTAAEEAEEAAAAAEAEAAAEGEGEEGETSEASTES
jgi:large subunit ribosomal protein L25